MEPTHPATRTRQDVFFYDPDNNSNLKQKSEALALKIDL